MAEYICSYTVVASNIFRPCVLQYGVIVVESFTTFGSGFDAWQYAYVLLDLLKGEIA